MGPCVTLTDIRLHLNVIRVIVHACTKNRGHEIFSKSQQLLRGTQLCVCISCHGDGILSAQGHDQAPRSLARQASIATVSESGFGSSLREVRDYCTYRISEMNGRGTLPTLVRAAYMATAALFLSCSLLACWPECLESP